MKYFSREFCTGELSDSEQAIQVAKYQSRIAKVWSEFPEPVKVLCSRSLHDAIVDFVRYDKNLSSLDLGLISGDLQVGYRLIVITYRGAILTGDSYQAILEASASEDIELAVDEWDVVDNNTFAHRILFFDGGEFEVLFASADYTETPRADRNRSKKPDVNIRHERKY